ncbi:MULTISPECIES: hypothetical protein [unclassified Coleofasciculus]|uniref:hypothetical protein n=1 Tax=unclassified Coleofasciculus TaxID=2692782 RepID=UPI0018808974|nr:MULTISPECIES: hypothetical protein [unclassified Coleofasciculus]MBE9128706.1 hypothetical protein [Coleofasciculus sp. LEGE 07081]MBE9149879.1 hypothetical protein [Coleofasciculus sp. LEGE 07092]
MSIRQIWEVPPDSIAVPDRLEGLDIYDALSEDVIDMDDLPVRSGLKLRLRSASTPSEVEVLTDEEKLAEEPDSLYTEF